MKVRHQFSVSSGIFIALCSMLLLNASHAQSDQPAFPAHWEKPPTEQASDSVVLPYGYGYGSSTLAKWIEVNIKLNHFPEEWGKAPVNLADDYVKLPGNYGYGSSTLRTWILSKTGDLNLSPATSRPEGYIKEWRPYPSPTPVPSPSPTPRRRPPIRAYIF